MLENALFEGKFTQLAKLGTTAIRDKFQVFHESRTLRLFER